MLIKKVVSLYFLTGNAVEAGRSNITTMSLG
jgi:hypothetical protein